MAEVAKVKIAFTENTLNEDTQVAYYRGDVAELPPTSAMRIVGEGRAVVVEEEELKQQTSEELDQTAGAIGVDVSGEQKKADKAKKIAQST